MFSCEGQTMNRKIAIGVLAAVLLVVVGSGAAVAQAGPAPGPAAAPTYIMDGPVEDAEPVTTSVGVSTWSADLPVYVLKGPVDHADSVVTPDTDDPADPHFLL